MCWALNPSGNAGLNQRNKTKKLLIKNLEWTLSLPSATGRKTLPHEQFASSPNYCTFPAQLCKLLKLNGAGEGNRTLVSSLENCRSTIELHPQRANDNARACLVNPPPLDWPREFAAAHRRARD